MKPVIGINTTVLRAENENPSLAIRANYVDAVVAAGGVPLLLPSIPDQNDIRQQVALCDGFIFIGGPDIDPAKYGQERHPTTSMVPGRRDQYDFLLIAEVMHAEKPFLAVCLGCQQLNVALGGSLIQDLHSLGSARIQHQVKQAPHLSRHDVSVEPGSILHRLVGSDRMNTNSSHHQAVGVTSDRVRVTARAEDGVIECFELLDYPFGLAVQWHPEHLIQDEAHLALFRGLIVAAGTGAQSLNSAEAPTAP